MMKQGKLLAIGLGFALLFASTAMAQPGPRPEHKGPRGHMGMMQGKACAGLQLTDEQQNQMADLRLELQKQMEPLRAKMVVLRSDLKLLMIAETPDMKKIEAKSNEISKLQGETHLLQLKHKLQVRSMLTPEQKKKFDLMILSGKGGSGHHRGGRGQHRMMPPGGMAPMPR